MSNIDIQIYNNTEEIKEGLKELKGLVELLKLKNLKLQAENIELKAELQEPSHFSNVVGCEITICENCNGKGRVKYDKPYTSTCPICEGTRLIC